MAVFIASWYLFFAYTVPIQNRNPPNSTLAKRCCPTLHAILYKYLGEKTLHIKRCVLNAVHASMIARTLAALNTVSNNRCRRKTCSSPSSRFLSKSIIVADIHHKGPAQLEQNTSIATAITRYVSTPLYELERSMDEIALDPPNAKKLVYWRIRDVSVVSVTVASIAART